jgi:hypothetical protein
VFVIGVGVVIGIGGGFLPVPSLTSDFHHGAARSNGTYARQMLSFKGITGCDGSLVEAPHKPLDALG